MTERYVIAASRRSVALAVAIVFVFALGAIGAAAATTTNWSPFWERRFGLAGVVLVGAALVWLAIWLGRGVLRGLKHRHKLVSVEDGRFEIQTFRGRVVIDSADIADITCESIGGGKKLCVYTHDGHCHSPMFLPDSSNWDAEARVLRAMSSGAAE
jgi:hypothetical protein